MADKKYLHLYENDTQLSEGLASHREKCFVGYSLGSKRVAFDIKNPTYSFTLVLLLHQVDDATYDEIENNYLANDAQLPSGFVRGATSVYRSNDVTVAESDLITVEGGVKVFDAHSFFGQQYPPSVQRGEYDTTYTVDNETTNLHTTDTLRNLVVGGTTHKCIVVNDDVDGSTVTIHYHPVEGAGLVGSGYKYITMYS